MKKTKYYCIFFVLLFIILLINSVSAEETDDTKNAPVVIVEYFYGEICSTCATETTPIINEIEEYYGDRITIEKLPVDAITYHENLDKMNSYSNKIKNYPVVVVKNLSVPNAISWFTYDLLNFSYENIKNSIEYHLIGNYEEEQPEAEKEKLCFGSFCIDVEEISLPALTIIVGFFDSLNPCSFFILLFLLNLLIYAKSRRRMALIGGIFIFFSGFIYFLLMVIIYLAFNTIEQPIIITMIAGSIALIFGIISIKDFFYFKQGFSLSVSDKNKKKLFQRMRELINVKSLPAMIGGTVLLAIFANTYELGCTLILPVVYINALSDIHNISPPEGFYYIFFYNIIYVIPLIVIVMIFVVTLGRKKLSEFQGRTLKLFSGIMISSFGVIMLVNPMLLKDLTYMFLLFVISVVLTLIISNIWKKYFEKQKIDKNYPSE